MAFRKRFNFPNLSVANWFPGHMAKGLLLVSSLFATATLFTCLSCRLTGMRNMGRRLQYCDCIIEVHDARVSQILAPIIQ